METGECSVVTDPRVTWGAVGPSQAATANTRLRCVAPSAEFGSTPRDTELKIQPARPMSAEFVTPGPYVMSGHLSEAACLAWLFWKRPHLLRCLRLTEYRCTEAFAAFGACKHVREASSMD